MAGILTRTNFEAMTFTLEDRFVAYTNMYVSHNYEYLRGFYFHIANERPGGKDEQQNKLMRLKLFAMGVIPGVPDFEVLLPTKWWLELKIPGRTTSPAQGALHKRWRSIGEIIHIAWTPVEVTNIFERMCGKPTFM